MMILPSRRCVQKPSFLLALILALAVLQLIVLESSSSRESSMLSSPTKGETTAATFSGPQGRSRAQAGHSSSTSSSTSTSLQNLTLLQGPIFYNLFVPNDTSLRKNTQRIVEEQLLQRNWTCPNATIQYTLIGGDVAFQEYVASHCSGRCQLESHLSAGNEQHTLQRLWDYCQAIPSDSSQDWLVTYIHDKGSFHSTESNEKARRMATKAALDCRNVMPQAKNPRACNICMGAFHVFPQYLASANMWTARCSYIRGLYPPQEYSARLQEMYDTTLNHSSLQYSPDYVCLKPYHEAPNFWGIGRYSLERWPLSHPNVKPCDVLPLPEGQLSWDDFPQTWIPQLQKAPHESAKALGIQTGPYKSTFARLAGRLFEWKFVYGTNGSSNSSVPPSNSWIWKWYRGYEEGASGFLKKCRALTRTTTTRTAAAEADGIRLWRDHQ